MGWVLDVGVDVGLFMVVVWFEFVVWVDLQPSVVCFELLWCALAGFLFWCFGWVLLVYLGFCLVGFVVTLFGGLRFW